MINRCVTYSLICFNNYLDGRKHKILIYQVFKQHFIFLILVKYNVCCAVVKICQHRHNRAYASRSNFKYGQLFRVNLRCNVSQPPQSGRRDHEINPFVGRPDDSTLRRMRNNTSINEVPGTRYSSPTQ